MTQARWMIYGAYGYTGELIAREAVRNGMTPILAGHDAQRVEALATELGLTARTFVLDQAEPVATALADVSVLLNCAGPFAATAPLAVDACIAAGTHYLDITGEIDVFEAAFERAGAARDAGVVVCPGVGFDVVPTDCVAARLAVALPDATHLALGFDSRSGFSPGTAKTALEGLAAGGRVRREGHVKRVPLAADVRDIDFGDGCKTATTIPWGDVATAWYSTGIDNIAVYMPLSPGLIKRLKHLNWVRPVMRLEALQTFIKARIGASVQGPDAAARARQPTWVWGEVRNAAGARRVARMQTANSYSVTVDASLAVVRHVLAQPALGGTYTPSRLIGPAWVEALPGSGPMHIDRQ